jgi:prepilin-type N-terminal cleavage/methylation domain-containing protein
VSRHGQRGLTLVELLIALAIIGMMATFIAPAFQNLRRRAAAAAAAREIEAILYLARSRALMKGRNSGVRFAQLRGEWCYAIYDDGDGDGVRNDDIARGIDRPLFDPRPVLKQSRGNATIAAPVHTIVDPDGDELTPYSSPVQFNKSSICSFSPLGEATPGTIYLSDRNMAVFAVRVYGATGRTRLIRWNEAKRKWERA